VPWEMREKERGKESTERFTTRNSLWHKRSGSPEAINTGKKGDTYVFAIDGITNRATTTPIIRHKHSRFRGGWVKEKSRRGLLNEGHNEGRRIDLSEARDVSGMRIKHQRKRSAIERRSRVQECGTRYDRKTEKKQNNSR